MYSGEVTDTNRSEVSEDSAQSSQWVLNLVLALYADTQNQNNKPLKVTLNLVHTGFLSVILIFNKDTNYVNSKKYL